MNSTTELDDRIRKMNTQLDRATPQPPAFDALWQTARPRPTRLMPIAAAASIVILGVGGLVVAAARNDNPPARSSAPIEAVINDPRRISLDPWADPDDAVSPCPCVVLDLATLPDEWSGETVSAGFNLSSNGYRTRVALSNPNHDDVTLTLQSRSDASGEIADVGGDVITIDNDTDARVSANMLMWRPGEMLQAVLTISSDSQVDTVVQLARDLRFVNAAELPAVTLPDQLAPARETADAELAGTMNGHRWQLDVGSTTAISINLAVDGVGIDAMSRDSGDPQPSNTIDMSIAAVGRDTILYGRTPPTATRLTIELDDAAGVQVPVFRRGTDTVFGVPIPTGLPITALAFSNDAGIVIHRVLIPELPTPILSQGLPAQSFSSPTGQSLL